MLHWSFEHIECSWIGVIKHGKKQDIKHEWEGLED